MRSPEFKSFPPQVGSSTFNEWWVQLWSAKELSQDDVSILPSEIGAEGQSHLFHWTEIFLSALLSQSSWKGINWILARLNLGASCVHEMCGDVKDPSHNNSIHHIILSRPDLEKPSPELQIPKLVCQSVYVSVKLEILISRTGLKYLVTKPTLPLWQLNQTA